MGGGVTTYERIPLWGNHCDQPRTAVDPEPEKKREPMSAAEIRIILNFIASRPKGARFRDVVAFQAMMGLDIGETTLQSRMRRLMERGYLKQALRGGPYRLTEDGERFLESRRAVE